MATQLQCRSGRGGRRLVYVWTWVVGSATLAMGLGHGASSVGCESECPKDENRPYEGSPPGQTLCQATDHTIIVHFGGLTAEEIEERLKPIGAVLACEGRPDPEYPGCYLVRLADGMCCSDGMEYFEDDDSQTTLTDYPHPESPCSCYTGWTLG